MSRQYGNIGAGLLVFSLWLVYGYPARSEDNPSEWLRVVVAGERQRMEWARQAAIAERAKTVAALLEVVRRPVVQNEGFWDPNTARNSAIFLLGRMRAIEAIPDLVKCLEPQPAHSRSDWGRRILFPSAAALVAVGTPAVPAVLAKLKEAGCSDVDMFERLQTSFLTSGDQCVAVLGRILGRQEAMAFLKRSLSEETSEKAKATIETAIAVLEGKAMTRYLRLASQDAQSD